MPEEARARCSAAISGQREAADGSTWTGVFAQPEVRFVNLNVAGLDAHKQAGLALVADAREGLLALTEALAGHDTGPDYRDRAARLAADWDAVVEAAYHREDREEGAHGRGTVEDESAHRRVERLLAAAEAVEREGEARPARRVRALLDCALGLAKLGVAHDGVKGSASGACRSRRAARRTRR